MILQPQNKMITSSDRQALIEIERKTNELSRQLVKLQDEYGITEGIFYIADNASEAEKREYLKLLDSKKEYIDLEEANTNAFVALSEEKHGIYREIENRYIESIPSLAAAMKELKEVVGAIEKKDFLRWVDFFKAFPVKKAPIKRNFAYCKVYIDWIADLQIRAAKKNGGSLDEIEGIITSKAAEFYRKPKNYKNAPPPLPPDVAQLSDNYTPLLQGKITNIYATMNARGAKIDTMQPDVAIIKKRGVTVTKRNYNYDKTLTRKDQQILDMLVTFLSSQIPVGKSITEADIGNKRTVTFSVDDYMELFSLKDRKTARQQLKKTLDTLYDVNIQGTDEVYIKPEGRGKKPYYEPFSYDMRIATAKAELTRKGIIAFSFSPEYAMYLANSYIMQIPKAAFKINTHANPHSYNFIRKLSEHHNMNIIDKNANIISVKTLIDSSPEFPDYKDIRGGGRIAQRIIEPFERDMNLLEDMGLISWQYCNANNTPLSEEQLYNMSYNTFIGLNVYFVLKDYPDTTERVKQITAEREKVKKLKQERTQKSKANKT